MKPHTISEIPKHHLTCQNNAMNRLYLLLLVALSATASASELEITGSTWPPYVTQQLYKNGVAVVLTEEALIRAGYKPITTIESWPESLEATADGTYDVITGVWLTDERAEQLEFSEPFIKNYIVFVTRDDNYIEFNEREDLKGLRIGVVKDYAYSNEPYDTTGINISAAGSARENIQHLLAGELDLVLADSRVALFEIDQLIAGKQLSIIRKPLVTRGLRIAVAKTHPDAKKIVADFDASIAAMKLDGSYNAILATFRISD
jgi:polar amino acid transport system substrate-binding protein